jgi:hypothetical protein
MIAGMFSMSRLDHQNHQGTLQASDFHFSHQDLAHFLFLSPYCLPWPQSGPQLPRKNWLWLESREHYRLRCLA